MQVHFQHREPYPQCSLDHAVLRDHRNQSFRAPGSVPAMPQHSAAISTSSAARRGRGGQSASHALISVTQHTAGRAGGTERACKARIASSYLYDRWCRVMRIILLAESGPSGNHDLQRSGHFKGRALETTQDAGTGPGKQGVLDTTARTISCQEQSQPSPHKPKPARWKVPQGSSACCPALP